MTDLPELLLLRHGETEWNLQGRFQGALDSTLTARGRAQAEAMGGVLRSLGAGPLTHAALTSPQGRARETARITLEPLGLVARDDPRLVEIGMGLWTGLCRQDIEDRWPGPAAEPLFDFYARCPGGETLAEVGHRARAVLAELSGPTIIVTHGMTLRVLCALALGRPLEEGGAFAMRQGSLVRVAGGRMEIIAPEPMGLPALATRGNPSATGG
ncbi:histidine phosphatase family protein [Rubellimicrobium arenae]|uniref:histidine phosphatase family protein n=1 Tax=Rubellimicrobium arenae TaxID=2817372 RepID=UPI001B309219|nr:histidine phosphatase family protein [Rubellimicrobium arenae]